MTKELFFGFGNNVDFEAKLDLKLLGKLVELYNIKEEDLEDIDIYDIRSLIISILFYMRSGQGAERLIETNEIINEFIKFFDYSISMGGTPIRAATELSKIGIDSYIHFTTYNDTIKNFIPAGCEIVTSSDSSQIYPHLIIQFNKGDTVESNSLYINAPKANRIIYHRDVNVQNLKINQVFFDLAYRARALAISGFNAIQNKNILRDRLCLLSNKVKQLPKSCLIYYEDGGFYNNYYRKEVSEILGSLIDIHGMNEDELQSINGNDINLNDAEEVLIALEKTIKFSKAKCLLVHTSDWSLVFGYDCAKYGQYIRNGINLATTRLIFGDNFTIDDYRNVSNLSKREESIKFKLDIESLSSIDVVCEPSYIVNNKNLTTIGLGDSFMGGFLSEIVK